MTKVLAAKEIRNRFVAALNDPVITVNVAGAPVEVTFLEQPPRGWRVSEDLLPAIYVFNSGEDLDRAGINTMSRALATEVVLMAHDSGDPQDQLDEMQLAVEQAIIASNFLDGAVVRCDPTSVRIAQDQGAIVFGVRVITFRPEATVTASDPSF